jgi:hypothetical protein
VSNAVARRKDVPIYATGLGTARASLTIAIHSQVDGKLQEMSFTEGQSVEKGGVLAIIDPRLLQAALDQARAKKLKTPHSLSRPDVTLHETPKIAASRTWRCSKPEIVAVGSLTTPPHFPSAQILRRFAPIPYQIGEFRGMSVGHGHRIGGTA